LIRALSSQLRRRPPVDQDRNRCEHRSPYCLHDYHRQVTFRDPLAGATGGHKSVQERCFLNRTRKVGAHVFLSLLVLVDCCYCLWDHSVVTVSSGIIGLAASLVGFLFLAATLNVPRKWFPSWFVAGSKIFPISLMSAAFTAADLRFPRATRLT
jgi:hypothetical protein